MTKIHEMLDTDSGMGIYIFSLTFFEFKVNFQVD